MTDYNWFFSTLSQCAAAIAGFFGAFIITKIINRESEFNNLTRRLKLIKSEISKQKSDLNNRYFDWYNKNTREDVFNSDNFHELLSEIDLNNITDENIAYIYFFSDFSPYENYDSLKRLIIEKIKIVNSRNYSRRILPLNIASYIKNLNDEKEKITREISQAYYLIDKIKLIKTEVEAFPDGRSIISYSLLSILLIFFIGIIYPLNFLPQNSNFSICFNIRCLANFFCDQFSIFKSILLFIFSAIFVIIIYVFNKKNKSHYFNSDDIDILDNYLIIDNYSDYIKNYNANEILKNNFERKMKEE